MPKIYLAFSHIYAIIRLVSFENKKMKKIDYPNLFGNSFLVAAAEQFLLWAGLEKAPKSAQNRFKLAIIDDFLDQSTAVLFEVAGKEKVQKLIDISKKDQVFSKREEEYRKLIPEYDNKMKAVLRAFRLRIKQGEYDEYL